MNNNQIQLQSETISQVISILKKYDSVSAVFLTGSQADNINTSFSDIDLTVVFENDERKYLEKIFNEIASIKPILSTLYQLFDRESLILFEDGIRLDLTFEKRSSFNKDSLTKYKTLYNNDSTLIHKLGDNKKKAEIYNKPKWNDKEGSYIDWFFWMFRQAYCYICQSETVRLKSFEKKDLAISSIKSIRDKLLETLYYINEKKDYLANIDENLLNEFSKTYATGSVEEIKIAIRTLVKLYEIIINRYCEKERIIFPENKVKRIIELFDEFDNY